MQQLLDIIHKVHRLLLEINAGALSSPLISLTEAGLKEIDVNQALENCHQSLPVKNSKSDDTDDYTKQINTIADQINKALGPLNKSLEKVKQLRHTLNLPALDGVISLSQKIVRAIYQFTSTLNSPESNNDKVLGTE